MRLIDADALYKSFGASGNCNNCPLDAYKCQYYNEHTLMEFCERIDDAPTVDPTKHGHWIAHSKSILGVPTEACSECGEWSCGYNSSFCSHCGAKMDKDWEEPEINPCRGCTDYDGQGGCKSNGGCGAKMDEVEDV